MSASSSFLPMEVFLLAAAIYLVMSLPIAFLTRRLEARFSAARRMCEVEDGKTARRQDGKTASR